MTRDEIIDLFIGNAAKAAAEPVRVNNNDELNSALGSILAESESIFCPAVTDKEKAVQQLKLIKSEGGIYKNDAKKIIRRLK